MTLSAEPPLILVVDDDPGSRDVAARLLEREGYRTRQAESGDECLRIVADDARSYLGRVPAVIATESGTQLYDGVNLGARRRHDTIR